LILLYLNQNNIVKIISGTFEGFPRGRMARSGETNRVW